MGSHILAMIYKVLDAGYVRSREHAISNLHRTENATGVSHSFQQHSPKSIICQAFMRGGTSHEKLIYGSLLQKYWMRGTCVAKVLERRVATSNFEQHRKGRDIPTLPKINQMSSFHGGSNVPWELIFWP